MTFSIYHRRKQQAACHGTFWGSSFWSVLLATASTLSGGSGWAQTQSVRDSDLQIAEGRTNERRLTELELPPPIVTAQTQFEIPFRTDDLQGRLVEVQLYVSTDLGLTWNLYARQSPATTRIPFQSVGDGEYLFALKTLDRDSRLLPTGPPIPTLRMVVDTAQPELRLRVEPDKSGRVSITWRATDQNLDATTLQLSYRLDGPNLPNQWFPLKTGRPANADQSADPTLFQDRVTWLPDAVADAVVLKAEIQDHAGNVVTSYQPVGLGALRSAAPGPLLQGGQANILTPPDPQLSGSSASAVGLKPTANPVAVVDPATPIDWPVTSATGGQAIANGGQAPQRGPLNGGVNPSTERAETAQDGRSSPAVDAQPVHWPGGPIAIGGNSSLETNSASDPFRRLMTGPPVPLQDGLDPNLSTQNLAVSVGTTLQHSGGQASAQGQSSESIGGQSSPGVPPNFGGPSNAVGSFTPPNTPLPAGRLNGPPNRLPPASLPTDPAKVSVPNGMTGRTEAAGVAFPRQPNQRPLIDSQIARFQVNTRQFRLRYQVDGLTPTQIAAVSIFCSRDQGSSWELWTEDRDKTSPVEIVVPLAGQYAFRVCITSTTGSTSPIPRPGDEPEVMVEVDLDPPSPKIVAAPFGRNAQPASLIIQWNCDAMDLGADPVTLGYSHTPTGPWTTIVAATKNTGEFEWAMQPNLPRQVYLRIEVTDAAGNRGVHMLDTPIDIGPLLPRGRLLGIDK